jgi:hypothetical protein
MINIIMSKYLDAGKGFVFWWPEINEDEQPMAMEG